MIPVGITQIEYNSGNSGPTIHIFGRTKNGAACRVDVDNFRPYFYILNSEKQKALKNGLIVDNQDYLSIRGEKLLKVYTTNPGDVRDKRESYTHHEADIAFGIRFLVDRGITSGIKIPELRVDYREVIPEDVSAPLRMCFLDIECSDENGFPTADKDPIISISCWDSFEDKYITFFHGPFVKGDTHEVVLCRSEKDLLARFIQYMKRTNPDLLGGWNVDKFDIPYINKRMEVNHIPTDSIARLPGRSMPDRVRGRIVFDLLAAYKKILRSEIDSYRLDNVATIELGETKVRFKGKLFDLLKSDPKTFVEYNRKDVELCVGINKKKKITDFFYEIARFAGIPMDKTLWSSNVVDVYVLRKASGKFVLPSRPSGEGEKYEGAFVLEPGVGLKKNVAVFDLKALYPMIIMSLNMSLETKNPKGEYIAPNGVRFLKSPDGLSRELIADLLKQRDERKKLRNTFPYDSQEYKVYDLQQEVMKVIMNTYYGVSGSPRFRLYDREIASAITATGREIILFTIDEIGKMGYKTIASDTDSCFCEIRENGGNLIEIARGIEKEVNSKYDAFSKKMGIDHHYFSIKFEKLYSVFLQTGKKKRYVGRLIWKEGVEADSIDITGFESRRSDTPKIAKGIFKEIIEMILNEEDYSVIKEKVKNFIIKYRTGKFSLEDIGIPNSITKPFSEYKSKDAHIRGAEYSNKYFGTNFGAGSKPKRVYVKALVDRHYPITDVICFEFPEQIPNSFIIDYETMLEKTVRDPIMRVAEVLGWSWADLDPQSTTLADFGIG